METRYLQCQGYQRGKAEYLEAFEGATRVDDPPLTQAEFERVSARYILICVIDNVVFESAAVVETVNDWKAFTQKGDKRRKTWLLMQFETVNRLLGR